PSGISADSQARRASTPWPFSAEIMKVEAKRQNACENRYQAERGEAQPLGYYADGQSNTGNKTKNERQPNGFEQIGNDA
ncbi:MAG: hypothetical protein AAF299_03585, partial [Pseudomonadota bacterium]